MPRPMELLAASMSALASVRFAHPDEGSPKRFKAPRLWKDTNKTQDTSKSLLQDLELHAYAQSQEVVRVSGFTELSTVLEPFLLLIYIYPVRAIWLHVLVEFLFS